MARFLRRTPHQPIIQGTNLYLFGAAAALPPPHVYDSVSVWTARRIRGQLLRYVADTSPFGTYPPPIVTIKLYYTGFAHATKHLFRRGIGF